MDETRDVNPAEWVEAPNLQTRKEGSPYSVSFAPGIPYTAREIAIDWLQICELCEVGRRQSGHVCCCIKVSTRSVKSLLQMDLSTT